MTTLTETKTWECLDCLETFEVKAHYYFSYCPRCHRGHTRDGSVMTDLYTSLFTIVSGLRQGWWGQGSGEFEEGELDAAEAALAAARTT